LDTHHWKQSELGTHSYAESPFYTIHMNGKVDINPKQGKSDNKIELQVNGMFAMVKDWLSSGHQLDENKRAELIDLLATYGKKVYNPNTKTWIDKEKASE
jgi:hypothetical protein